MNERRLKAMGVQLGKRLAAARKLSNLTQREAAARLGKPASFVTESETGRRRVLVVELVEFSRLYRRPLAFFVEPFTAPGAAER